nr:uncharacterized protein LOC109185271 [Ipomoea batatas]
MDSRGKIANLGRDTGPPGEGRGNWVLENWIVKGGVGDDADECDGSGFEWYDSGEESNGSDEDYNSEDLVNIDVHDDDEFVKNIDVTVEFSGLSNVQLQPQQVTKPVNQVRRRKSSCKSKGVPQVQIPVATTNCVEGEPQFEVAVEPQPNVSTECNLKVNLKFRLQLNLNLM